LNDLVLFIHMLLLLLRIIGLIMAIDFYFRLRNKIFRILSLGWFVWTLGILFTFFYVISDNLLLSEWFYLFAAIFTTLGFFLVTVGFFFYFLKPPTKFIVLICSYVIIVPIIAYIFIDLITAIQLAIGPINLIIFGVFLIPLFKKVEFKKTLGKSVRWYYVLMILGFLYIPITIYLSVKYTHWSWRYESTTDIIDITLNFMIVIIATLLIILNTSNIEYTLSTKEKSTLKDKYSHNLGNIMQSISSSLELIKRKNLSKEEAIEVEGIIEMKIDESCL